MSDSIDSTADSLYRSGRYQSQLTGYRAFVPAALPPNPPVRMDGELQSLLSLADRALGRLDGSIQTLPNPDLFVFMYVRKEAVLSAANNLVARLAKLGILQEATGYKRNRVFHYAPYITIFGDNASDDSAESKGATA
jgi:hypothetical protein